MIVYKCRKCGHILFKYEKRTNYPLPTPVDVAYHYNFKCPYCGAQLNPEISLDYRERIIIKLRNKH
jgi:hypothetical protein